MVSFVFFGIKFSTIAFITSSVTIAKREVTILKFSATAIITSHEVILRRYDGILDYSDVRISIINKTVIPMIFISNLTF